MDSGTSRKLAFSKQASLENVKPSRFLRNVNLDLFQRSYSALARHRVHELSDIREVSGSSKAGTVSTKPSAMLDGSKEAGSTFHLRNDDGRSELSSSEYNTTVNRPTIPHTPPKALASRVSSAVSLPLREIPERRSSASILGQSVGGSRPESLHDFPSWKLPPPSAAGKAIPSRGRTNSPIRQSLKRDAVSSDLLRPSPSRTFIRTTTTMGLLESGSLRHDRVDMRTRLPSHLFVGGGTVEGHISLIVDGGSPPNPKNKPVLISKLSVDIIGVEEVSDGRKWIFLSLATELFDESHPPPPSLVISQLPMDSPELFWTLKPSSSTIPFCLNLPLNLGPPPYLSKQARIRYVLCPTALIKVGNKKSLVRQLWNIQMLTVHDPEKALASLPSPLIASDFLSLPHATETQNVKLTAGLHRQTWVNGSTIFVDIHVVNNSGKIVKKIEVQLEKVVLWYVHTAAGTAEKSASHLRLPRRSENELISTTVLKRSKKWPGVVPHSSEIKTCEVNVPRGHVTISTGRYFEVRYFLNVIATLGIFKAVAVQLPVTIVHINSLDILPNSLAQVAASIEAKRARTVPIPNGDASYSSYHQGQAFAAPRRQSLDRMRYERGSQKADDINALAIDFEKSPRRFGKARRQSHGRNSTLNTIVSYENTAPSCVSGSQPTMDHHHHMRHPSCYHCQLDHSDPFKRPVAGPSPPGPKLPRLQISTSGLGFSDSEFEFPPDSPPRKVMLSESERRMIHQQKELKMQRQWSQRTKDEAGATDGDNGELGAQAKGHNGWKNVAVGLNGLPGESHVGPDVEGYVKRHMSRNTDFGNVRDPVPTRTRSKTNPDPSFPRSKPSQRQRGPRSLDRSAQPPFGFDGPSQGINPARKSRDRSREASVRRW